MENHDWTRFETRISINASLEKIFNSWTTQENLEQWFLSKAVFKTDKDLPRPRASQIMSGDSYTFMWHGSEDVDEGKILENNTIDFLRLTFLGCEVSVEVQTEKGAHILELTQYNIPLDETSTMHYFVGCTRGWTFYLTNLKSVLEGGLDLRNKNSELKNVINT